MQELSLYEFRFAGDKSGYDRLFPLMEEIYMMRARGLKGLGPTQLEKLFEVIQDMVEQVVVLKDGSVYMKYVGNPSGSNQTTEDNCIGALIMHFYLFIKLYLYYKHEVPTLEIILETALVNIYGDDDLGGYHWRVFTEDLEDFTKKFKEMYYSVHLEFGMTVKFLEIEVGGKVKDVREGGILSFLGSRPLLIDGFYYPKPDCSHLAASLITFIGDDSLTSIVSKIRAAVDLTYCIKEEDEESRHVYEFSLQMAQHYSGHPDIELADQLFLDELLIGDYNPRGLMTGYEGRNFHSPPSVSKLKWEVIFSPPQLEGGWHKKFILEGRMSKQKQLVNVRGQERRLRLENEKKGKHIAQLEARIHQMKSNNGQVSEFEASMACKDFVMDLVNPEGSRDLKWPDQYSENTSTYKAVNNFFLPVALNSHGNFPAGSFYLEAHPELNDTILYLSEFDGTSEQRTVHGQIASGNSSNNFGFYTSEFRPVETAIRNDTYHIAMEVMDEFGTPQIPRFASPETANVASSGFWYLPCVTGGGNTMRVAWSNVGGPFDYTLRQVSSDGTVLATVSGTGASLGGGIANIVLATSLDDLYSFKVEFEVTNQTSDEAVLGLEALCSYKLNHLKMINEPLQDQTQLGRDIEKYRVVAQSLLATYVGSELTNAGDVAALMYRGGVPAQFSRLATYSDIAEHPDAYEGKLKDGTYTYWEGQDAVDYSFRSIFAKNDYRRPYHVVSGLYVGDPTSGVINNANFIRVRVITVVEFTSRSQVYSSGPSPVCPELIVLSARVLAGVPNAMENGKHMAKLKQIAGGVGRFLKKTGTGS
jgi:hypothetical protein